MVEIFSIPIIRKAGVLFGALIMGVFLPNHLLAGDVLYLDDYLGQVKTAHPLAESARWNAEAEARLVRPAGAWDDPVVSFGPDEIPLGESGGMLRYTIGQGIPFPGKSGARREAARYRAQAAGANAETLVRELVVAATTIYYQTMLAEQTIARNEEIRGLLHQIAEAEKARYGAGMAAHHGWLLARLEADLLETELLRLKRELANSKAILNELRDAPMGTPVRLPLDLPDLADVVEAVEKLSYEEALAAQPERLALAARYQAAEQEVRAGRLAYYPDFMVQTMFMQSRDEMMPDAWGAMMGLTLPLFWDRKQSELLAAARHRRSALEADRRALDNRLEVAWQDAVRQWRTAADVYAQYRDVVLPRTRLAEEAARSGYAADLMSVREYLDILRVRRVLDIELLAARLDVALAEVRLREFLAAPPMLRLAPRRPTLFGGEGMGMGSAPMGMPAGDPAMPPPSPRMREMPGGMQPGSQQPPGMGGM